MDVDTSVVKKEYDRNPVRWIEEEAYPGSDVARSNKVRGTSQATRAGSENVLQEDKSLNWQENSWRLERGMYERCGLPEN